MVHNINISGLPLSTFDRVSVVRADLLRALNRYMIIYSDRNSADLSKHDPGVRQMNAKT